VVTHGHRAGRRRRASRGTTPTTSARPTSRSAPTRSSSSCPAAALRARLRERPAVARSDGCSNGSLALRVCDCAQLLRAPVRPLAQRLRAVAEQPQVRQGLGACASEHADDLATDHPRIRSSATRSRVPTAVWARRASVCAAASARRVAVCVRVRHADWLTPHAMRAAASGQEHVRDGNRWNTPATLRCLEGVKGDCAMRWATCMHACARRASALTTLRSHSCCKAPQGEATCRAWLPAGKCPKGQVRQLPPTRLLVLRVAAC
jgi:hypothetical protein